MKVTWALPLALGALAAVLALPTVADRQGQAFAQQNTIIGVDATPQRNTPTSVDSVDSCTSVDVGDTFEIDIVVVDVDDLLAWEAYLAYDSAVVRVVARDIEWFQAADAGSSLFNTSESVPDNGDGLFRVGAADLIDPPVGDNGTGVLARLALEALSKGTSSLSIAPVDLNDDGEPDLGSFMTDTTGKRIGDDNDDGFFDGRDLAAKVAVGEKCGQIESYDVAAGASEPTDNPDDGGGGWRWWMTALIGAGAGAMLLALVTFGYRRRRGRRPAGPGGDLT